MSVHPTVKDVFVMCRVVEQEVLEFIIPGGTKKWIVFCMLRQEFLEFFVMHKTGCHVSML